MRTASEIIKERYPFYDEMIAQKDVELNGEQVSNLINEARIETIKECADEFDDYYEPMYGFNKKLFLTNLIDEVR